MNQDVREVGELLPRIWELVDQVRARMVRITEGRKLFKDFDAREVGISELVKRAREVVEFCEAMEPVTLKNPASSDVQ